MIEVNKYKICSYSIFTKFGDNTAKERLDFCTGHDCKANFCKNLIGHAVKIFNCEERKMIPLTTRE